MHLPLLLDMATGAMGDRVYVGDASTGLTFDDLAARARAAAAIVRATGRPRVVLVDLNSDAVPIALFGAALANVPFVPVNYRLTDDQLHAILERAAPALVVVGDEAAHRIPAGLDADVMTRSEFLARTADPAAIAAAAHDELIEPDPDDIAVLLFTSGTTGAPKAAVLRHTNLASYIFDTVELASADEDDAALVSVPPYHIAGISAVLSNLFSGRRIVYLDTFEPEAWVHHIESHRVTNAMVVPTMLGRVLDVIERDNRSLESLRALSYGGGPMPRPVVERALRMLPHVGFVNAYGLTETSSTIALLGPDDHREAIASDDDAVRRRLGSVGRPVPSIELTIRDLDGNEVGSGVRGEIWVRGPQVSGEYLDRSGGATDGWFFTRDSGELDDEGYLYLHGRLDDVIVRGGENLSPGEIEAVLADHPSVDQAVVVGIPDNEWGERVVAAVVLAPGAEVNEEELKNFVRGKLRSTRTPERIDFREELPSNETGKILRRVLRSELTETFAPET